MKIDPQQVRLPELPIFKKYSLALREEFARASDLLAMLDRTSARVMQIVEKAEEKRRKDEESIAEQEAVAQTAEAAEVEAPSADLSAASLHEDQDEDRPFWEMDLPEEEVAHEPPPRRKAPAKRVAARTKPTVKRSQIVHVGDKGMPVSRSTASAKAKPKASASKAKPKAPQKAKTKAATSQRSKAKPVARRVIRSKKR